MKAKEIKSQKLKEIVDAALKAKMKVTVARGEKIARGTGFRIKSGRKTGWEVLFDLCKATGTTIAKKFFDIDISIYGDSIVAFDSDFENDHGTTRESKQSVQEAVGKNVYIIIDFSNAEGGKSDDGVECLGVFSSLEKAKDQLAHTFQKNAKPGKIEIDNDGEDTEYVVTANGEEKDIVIYEVEVDFKGMFFMTSYK